MSLRTPRSSNVTPNVWVRALHATQTFQFAPMVCCVALHVVVDGGQWRFNGGSGGGELAGTGAKTSRDNAPGTSNRRPGACERAVDSAVVANGGRGWGFAAC